MQDLRKCGQVIDWSRPAIGDHTPSIACQRRTFVPSQHARCIEKRRACSGIVEHDVFLPDDYRRGRTGCGMWRIDTPPENTRPQVRRVALARVPLTQLEDERMDTEIVLRILI